MTSRACSGTGCGPPGTRPTPVSTSCTYTGAHGYLMTQFLSTVLNLRTDGYGGSLRQPGPVLAGNPGGGAGGDRRPVRGRDPDRAARRLRRAWGRDPARHRGRRHAGPGRRMADDLVDLWDVTVGSWPEDSGTSRYYPEGTSAGGQRRMREATAKPVVAVGRYTSPDLMAQVIASGEADVIGSARQAIADPFLPSKIAEGRLDEIRECTGSNSASSARRRSTRSAACRTRQREEYRRGWHPEKFTPAAGADRPVLVVGAGPTGMECAVVLAKRGFGAIHLVEAEAEIGGRLRWTRRLPTLGDWGGITDWRAVQLASCPGSRSSPGAGCARRTCWSTAPSWS